MLTDWADNEGTLSDAAAETQITMALNTQVNWPANPHLSGNATHGINIAVAMTGNPNTGSSCSGPTGQTKLEAYAIKPEISPVGFFWGSGISIDTISFGYVKGQAQQYNVAILALVHSEVLVIVNQSVRHYNTRRPSLLVDLQATLSRITVPIWNLHPIMR